MGFEDWLEDARIQADRDLQEVGRLEVEDPVTFQKLVEAPGVPDPESDGLECNTDEVT